MTDIVERLAKAGRNLGVLANDSAFHADERGRAAAELGADCLEAKAEIERLREALAQGLQLAVDRLQAEKDGVTDERALQVMAMCQRSLSELSVLNGGKEIDVPDYTVGPAIKLKSGQ